MISNYTNARHLQDLLGSQQTSLEIQNELSKLKERANIRRWTEQEPAFEVPKGIEKPKEFLTREDVRERVIVKLRPYFVNNHELIKFVEKLEDVNDLDDMDDLFDTFKEDYIKGARRLTSTRAQGLYDSFKSSKKFSKGSVPPRAPKPTISVPSAPAVPVPSAPRAPPLVPTALRVPNLPPVFEQGLQQQLQEQMGRLKGADIRPREQSAFTPLVRELQEAKEALTPVPETTGPGEYVFKKGKGYNELRKLAKEKLKKKPKNNKKETLANDLFDIGIRTYEEDGAGGIDPLFTFTGEPPEDDEVEKEQPPTRPPTYTPLGQRNITEFMDEKQEDLGVSGLFPEVEGQGMVRGLGYGSISNIPYIARQNFFERMFRTGWN